MTITHNTSMQTDPKPIIQAIMNGSAEVRALYSDLEPSPHYALPNLAKKLNLSNLIISDQSNRFGLKAFKGVGAYYAIQKILNQNRGITTLCTATDGNHGRAVAYAAQKFEKKAVIIVPEHTSSSRIKAIASYGAIVINSGTEYDGAVELAKKKVTESGSTWALVQDTAWENYTQFPTWIMQGYLQLCFELEKEIFTEEKAQVDTVILQSGVGSFAAAITAYLVTKYGANGPKIIHVEPTESDCIIESIKQGKTATTKKSQDTIMAGLNCGTPSTLAFPILKTHASAFITVTDDRVKHWMKVLYSSIEPDPQIISGESGSAVGLAAIESILKNNTGPHLGRVLLFNTEANTDPEAYLKIIQETALEIR